MLLLQLIHFHFWSKQQADQLFAIVLPTILLVIQVYRRWLRLPEVYGIMLSENEGEKKIRQNTLTPPISSWFDCGFNSSEQSTQQSKHFITYSDRHMTCQISCFAGSSSIFEQVILINSDSVDFCTFFIFARVANVRTYSSSLKRCKHSYSPDQQYIHLLLLLFYLFIRWYNQILCFRTNHICFFTLDS